MRRLLLAASAALAVMGASAAQASVLFQFDTSGSSIDVTENGRLCLPFSGCALDADLMTLTDFSLDVGQSHTFNFASFNVSPGFGGDSDARVDAVLSFLNPASNAGTEGTASYLRLGGFFTPGAVMGSLTWDNPVQQITTGDGSKYTVSFGNLTGVTFGSNAIAAVTITLDEVASTSAAPEPGAWALMILGFGGVGAALRRRSLALA